MRKVIPINLLTKEEMIWENEIEPLIRKRMNKLIETEEVNMTYMGVITNEYFLKAIQQLMNEEKIPIYTKSPMFNQEKYNQIMQERADQSPNDNNP